MSPPPHPLRVRRVLLLFVALGAGALGFSFASGVLVRLTTSPAMIAARLAERMRTPIRYESLDVSWDGAIRARGLAMARAGESEVVTGAFLEVRLSRWQLLRGEAVPVSVRFEGGTWNAARDESGGPMGAFFARNRTAGPLPFDFEILDARVRIGRDTAEGVRLRQEEGATAFDLEIDRLAGEPLDLALRWDGDTRAGRGRLRAGPCAWPPVRGLFDVGARGAGIRIDARLERWGDSLVCEGAVAGERLRIDPHSLVKFELEGRYERVGSRERILVTRGVDRALAPLRFSFDLRRRAHTVHSVAFDWDGPSERLPIPEAELRGRSAGRIRWTEAGYEGEFRPRGVAGRIGGAWRFDEARGAARFEGARWGERPARMYWDLAGRVARSDARGAGPRLAVRASVSGDRIDSGRVWAEGAPLDEILALLPEDARGGVSGSGAVDLDLRLGGTFRAPRLAGGIRLADATISLDSPAARLTGVTGTLRWDGSLREIDLASRAPRLTAKGTLPEFEDGPLRLTLAGERVPIALLARATGSGLAGAGEIARIDCEARGTLRAPQIRGIARLDGVSLRFPGAAREAENVRGTLAFDGAWIRAEDLRLAVGGSAMRILGGYRPADGSFSHFTLASDRVDLGRILEALPPGRRPFPPGTEIAGPVTELDLTLDGPPERIRAEGAAVAGGLAIRLPLLGAPIEEIQGRIRFLGDAARTDSITARFGGHRIYLTGEAPLGARGASNALRARYAVRRADLAALLPLLPGEAAGLLAAPASLSGTADLVGKIEVTLDRVVAEGEIGQGEIRLFGLDHRDVGGGYRYESGDPAARRRLELTSMRSSLGAGRIGGELLLESRGEAPPIYRLTLDLDRLPLDRALALAATDRRVRGEATGRIRVDGRWGDGGDARGEGDVRLEKVALEDLAGARSLVRAIRLDPTAARAPLRGGLTFTIGDGEVRTRDLVLVSATGDDLSLGAAGFVRLDGAADLDLTVDLAGGPLGFFLNTTRIASLFGAQGRGAVLRMRGKLTGPLADPRVDLDAGAWERIAR